MGNLSEPAEHVAEVLRRIKPEYLRRAYHIADWVDDLDFLTQLAKQTGKLGKGGEPDVQTAAKMILFDWQRGKIPFFTPPPKDEEFLAREGGAVEGASGPPGEEEAPLVVRQSLQKVPVQAEMFDEDDNRAQDGGEEDEGEQDEEEGKGKLLFFTTWEFVLGVCREEIVCVDAELLRAVCLRVLVSLSVLSQHSCRGKRRTRSL